MFAITAQQIRAIADFIGQLEIPWTQTNPIMQLLMQLPSVRVQPTAPALAPAETHEVAS
jgi:hypothetical protein